MLLNVTYAGFQQATHPFDTFNSVPQTKSCSVVNDYRQDIYECGWCATYEYKKQRKNASKCNQPLIHSLPVTLILSLWLSVCIPAALVEVSRCALKLFWIWTSYHLAQPPASLYLSPPPQGPQPSYAEVLWSVPYSQFVVLPISPSVGDCRLLFYDRPEHQPGINKTNLSITWKRSK